MNKTDLIQKLKNADDVTPEEKAFLINLVNIKKYGLVWQDKPEAVEEELRSKLPVLKEVREKQIIGDEIQISADNSGSQLFEIDENIVPEKNKVPNHLLIEGDNLHALTALSFTHEQQIDIIYIDPPYNTGNKDFKYHDAFKDEPEFIDKEHPFRHSTWLSFISKRLEIAKRLLKDTGVIFISIDDNEQSQLKLLCDEIFLNNFVACLPRITKSSGKTTNKIALNHDYVLVYCKNKALALIDGLEHNDKGFKNSDEHVEKRGLYKLNQTLDYDSLQYSSSLDYEIELDGRKFYPGSDYQKHLERKSGNYNRADWAWRWSKDLFEFGLANDFIVVKNSRNGSRIYTKTYLNAKIERSKDGSYCIEYYDRKKPLTSLDFTDAAYSNDNAKKDLEAVLKQSIFDYPKPISLVETLLRTNPNKEIVVLDFFAGSGTTMHATMQLNAEDGGSRQAILVTNNENRICEDVTYERNKRVITGYNLNNNEWVPGLPGNNLRYYKCDFVPSLKSEENKRKLTKASTELLCIKEDCFVDITAANGFNSNQCRVFTNDRGKYLLVVYHSRQQLQACEQLIAYIQDLSDLSEKVKLYGFSPEKETLIEDFADVANKIEAVPLPEAIYNAYRATFRAIRLDKKPPLVRLENTTEESIEQPLFNNQDVA